VALAIASIAVPAAAWAGDQEVAEQIRDSLQTSGRLKGYSIGVKYKDGVAALSGTVANQQQLRAALQLTQQMDGVDQVVNNLSIAGGNQNSLGKPAKQQATRAAYAGNGPQQSLAMRTSYQQGSGQQGPMGRLGMNGSAMNQVNPNMGPFGPRAPRPMHAGRMPQGRSNMPMPMGRRPVQQANAQQAMAQQQMAQQAQQAMAHQAMQAGCNCGPGGPGMGGPGMGGMGGGMGGDPAAMGYVPGGMGGAVSSDNAQMPGYAWPSYASYPNYAALSYPQQYSPSAWPYIGPFYPYPQVPLGWRKVALEWDDGWWFLDFSDTGANH
jgi:hypothetical protein